MKSKPNIYLLAAVGWTLLVFVLSVVPLPPTGTVTSPLPDKIVHAVFYMGLTLLWYAALRNRRIKYPLLKIVFFSFLYGIIIEVLQGMMPFNRHPDVNDALANATGIAAGVVLIKIHSVSAAIALKRKK